MVESRYVELGTHLTTVGEVCTMFQWNPLALTTCEVDIRLMKKRCTSWYGKKSKKKTWFTGFHTSKVVQDFFHQQHHYCCFRGKFWKMFPISMPWVSAEWSECPYPTCCAKNENMRQVDQMRKQCSVKMYAIISGQFIINPWHDLRPFWVGFPSQTTINMNILRFAWEPIVVAPNRQQLGQLTGWHKCPHLHHPWRH